VLAWLVAALLLVVFLRFQPAPLVVHATVEMHPVERLISRVGDARKPGTLRSVMGQLRFSQDARTSAPSPDRLDFRFDAAATIVGVLVSVDDRGMEMTEMAVGINAESYGIDARDWLIHTSDTAGGQSTDEQMWFDEGFAVTPADTVSVVAWIYNSRSDPYSELPAPLRHPQGHSVFNDGLNEAVATVEM